MVPAQAELELVTRLAAAGLSPSALVPWVAWKVFKRYLQAEVEGVYDAASFQCGAFPDDGSEGESFYATFVRQFSRWEGKEDAPVRRVVIEFRYDLERIQPAAVTEVWTRVAEIWTHDFPTLEEFASVVEGLPQFQAAMSVVPKHTEVYGEEL